MPTASQPDRIRAFNEAAAKYISTQDQNDFRKVISAARDALGYSDKQFGAALGVNPNYIQSWISPGGILPMPQYRPEIIRKVTRLVQTIPASQPSPVAKP